MTVSFGLTVWTVAATALFQTLSPDGMLGAGLETLNSNLVHLSDTTELNTSAVLSSLGSLQDLSQSSAVLLVSTVLTDKQKELQATNTEVTYLEEELYSIDTDCGERTSCSLCTASANCVWCEVEKRCAPGGVEGPLGGACMLYRYKECLNPECRDGRFCTACVVLGCIWCAHGGICLRKDHQAGICGFPSALESVNQCKLADLKAGKPKNPYTPQTLSMNPTNAYPNDKYRKLQQLKSSQVFLQQTISVLQAALQKLQEKLERPVARHAEMQAISQLADRIDAEMQKKEKESSEMSALKERNARESKGGNSSKEEIPREIQT